MPCVARGQSHYDHFEVRACTFHIFPRWLVDGTNAMSSPRKCNRHLHLECHELIRRPCQQCLLIFWFSHNQFFYIARCTNSELEHHQQDCIWTSPSCKPFLRRISNSLHVVVKWFHNCIGVLSCMGDVLISNAPHPCFWQLMLIQVVVEASWIRIIGFQLLKLLFDPQDRFYMKWTISGIHDVFKSK
jgi:hypothetical protein